ncbi:MAG: leucine-rich repeat protein, partial [Clostridiales Family XIII bacterium]|nr:leucine-rich repeat protein [Clostridiales Family XIII bacterium]
MILTLFTPLAAYADEGEAGGISVLDSEGDYVYTVSGGTATITGYTGAGGDIVIPKSLGGTPVTSIWYDAFYGCTSLTSVTIPDSVTSIGYYAFYGCTSLTSVRIPGSVTSIGDYAFRGCTSLTSIAADSANKNYSSQGGVLYNKDATVIVVYPEGRVGAFTVPDSVTSIRPATFYDCKSLTYVTIPKSVTSIGDYVFTGAESLLSITVDPDNENYKSVDGVLYSKDGTTILAYPGGREGAFTVPDSVTSIVSGTFDRCKSLTNVTIHKSVTSIGPYVFIGAESLLNITVDPDNENYKSVDGVLYSKEGTTILAYPGGREGAFVIPDGVTSIGLSAFEECALLTSVTIPEGVTIIGSYAFFKCTSLENVSIPDSVTSIDYYAFEGCTSLTSVTIPDSVTSIREGAFYGCTSLTSVTIPNSVTRIVPSAFWGCTSLTIYCYQDSYAHNYAKEWGIPYVLITDEEDRITVTLNANGGNVNPAFVSIVNGEADALLPMPSREGYSFAGWFTAAEDGTPVTDADLAAFEEDCTIYAHWTANTNTLTYDANGGNALSPSSKTVYYGAAYGTLPTPTRTGYDFAGWYTAASGGTQVTSTTVHLTYGNVTIYAHWTGKA